MKNKICILGNTNNPVTKKPNDPYSWFVKTFWQGFELNDYDVKLIDYKSNSLQQIRKGLITHKPDFVFTHLTFHNTMHSIDSILQLFSDLNKKHDIKFIHTCGDAREEDRYNKDISESFFAALVGTHGLIKHGEQKLKLPTYYCPYSSLTYHNIAEPVKDLSFRNPIFTGSPNVHDDRRAFIRLLEEYGCVKTFRTQSNNDLRGRSAELSSSASSILGLCTGYSINGYIDVRPFQYLGAGACMIARKFKTMDDIIPPDLYYPFNDYNRNSAKYVKDTSQKILKTDTWPMRTKAFRYIQQNHSSKVRMKQVIDVLEGKKKGVL